MTSTKALPLALLTSLALAAPASAATNESGGGTPAAKSGFISIKTGKAQITALTKSFATREGARSFLVFKCFHPDRNPGLVQCRVRLRFVDSQDGVTGFKRYIGTATPSRTRVRSDH